MTDIAAEAITLERQAEKAHCARSPARGEAAADDVRGDSSMSWSMRQMSARDVIRCAVATATAWPTLFAGRSWVLGFVD
ncbi:hypothetical protein [Streptomyces tendae]|uniref:Uncharacterized protein n=1 Tax=Streptomyces tendae TaxID=1932 RepID=A0ABX6A3G9_STRTE|nr:hypothetical protein [Streptomyces tendae]QER90411.1 hypothetical protein F3L20_32525 [Streptomyces tendae]